MLRCIFSLAAFVTISFYALPRTARPEQSAGPFSIHRATELPVQLLP